MTADILRGKFLAFFKAKKHKVVESDSLVPRDDPTVLFTPAGMNQFKKQFLGAITDFSRAASSQRCLRTDDLEKVGKTSSHHTFFEMLGNFSFGDYFKDEAISWAWEFLTEELNIDKNKLWISVYKDDDDSYKIWLDKIGVPKNKIIKLGDHDNFWPADAKVEGPNGPCGPCSEIFFDFGEDIGCKQNFCDPSCGCGRFSEIWNLVFTQYNRGEDGILEPLPKKNIDTGMGLERLTAVMQGVRNNFETELFQPLIKEINAHAKNNTKELTYAVADHIRAISFAIYDGVLPSNEARGYVVRKLIRKCSMHLRALEIKEPFLYRLVSVLTKIMQVSYPELKQRQEDIAQIILAEENGFITTLNSSNHLFQDKFKDLMKQGNPRIAGEIAFQLYDTYGIPFELTKDWLDKNKIEIMLEAFQEELEQQKSRSKSQSAMKGDVFSIKELHLGTKETKFLGYTKAQTKAKILRIVKDNSQVKKITKADQAKIILDKTVFYAESGGQVGDTGIIIKGKNVFQVQDTQKQDKVIVHTGIVKEGSFKSGDEVMARVDLERRLAIARNHTATHLLQAALRNVLGKHVKQQGSLVTEERLRFDFTHFKDMSQEELDRVEEEVNKYILDNYKLKAREMPLSSAKKTGALALFGEKYSGQVRVVCIANISKEFCGGTHLDFTSQIGLFKIIHEGSVASGVRRIEAVVGMPAYCVIKNHESAINEISAILNTPAEKLTLELQKRLSRIKELEKQFNLQKTDSAKASVDLLIQNALTIKDKKVITKIMDNLDMNLLRKTVDLIKEKTDNCVIGLGCNNQGRALLVMGVTEDLVQKGIDASILVRRIALEIGGSGGGRKDFAQAGGTKPENLQAAFSKLIDILGE
ncbi:MAG: alanine--tRNA ligase [Candidatus Omnitrophota bacterium]